LIIALLGLGIGSATLVFRVVNEALLKPLPVRDPDNLCLLARTTPGELRPNDSFDERQFYPGQSAAGKRLAQGNDGTKRPNRGRDRFLGVRIGGGDPGPAGGPDRSGSGAPPGLPIGLVPRSGASTYASG
jgi:hypothetical protein